jgi:hypothetical protein
LHAESFKLWKHDAQRFLGLVAALKTKSAIISVKLFTHMKLGHLTPSWSPHIEPAAKDDAVLLGGKEGFDKPHFPLSHFHHCLHEDNEQSRR